MLTTLVAQGIADVLGNVTISPNGPINPTSATSGQNPPWTPNAGSVLIGTLSIPGADANSQWNLLVNGLVIITFAAYGATINDFEVIQGQTITLSGTGLTAGKTYSVVYLAVASDANLTPDTVPYLSSNGNVSVTGSVTIPGTVTLGDSSNIIGAISAIGSPVAIGPGSNAIGTVLVSGGSIAISSGTITIGAIGGGVTMPVSGSVSATVSGSVSISSGTVSISGTPAVTITSGNVTVSGSVDVGTVSGSVTVTGTVDVGTISGSVTITGAVTITSGTVDIGTISGPVALGPGTEAIGTVGIQAGSQVILGDGTANIGTVVIDPGSQVNIENVSGTGISIENLQDTYVGISTTAFVAYANVSLAPGATGSFQLDSGSITYPPGLDLSNFHAALVVIGLVSADTTSEPEVNYVSGGLPGTPPFIWDQNGPVINNSSGDTPQQFTYPIPLTGPSGTGVIGVVNPASATGDITVSIILDQEPNTPGVLLAGIQNGLVIPVTTVAAVEPMTYGQATMGASSAIAIGGSRMNRSGITIHSLGSNTQIVYIGDSSVTHLTGYALEPGHDITIAAPVWICGITASGTAVVSYEDE